MSKSNNRCFLCQKPIEDMFVELPLYDAQTDMLVGSIDICIDCLFNISSQDLENDKDLKNKKGVRLTDESL